MNAAFLFDESFKNHVCQYYHPERPERLDAVLEGLEISKAWGPAYRVDPRPATDGELERVHDPGYVEATKKTLTNRGGGNLDPDTFFSEGTRHAALHAAGGGIDLVAAVHERKAEWGWAVVRPPGHHASVSSPGGFCIFNNIAVAAASLLAREDVERVAIFDWDVHHGNGTQDQFWDNPDLLFMSMHQWPHYPGSGLSNQIGGSQARGKTVNFPFPAGAGDGDFLAVIDEVLTPMLGSFRPDHILVSAGFDAHRNDPLSGMEATSECFGRMAARIKGLANEICKGRLTLFLEGGYDLDVLASSASFVVQGIDGTLEDHNVSQQPTSGSAGREVIKSTLNEVAPHWPDIF